MRKPSSRYQINYPAVLKWIKSGPMVLPPNLRAGRCVYYSSIPDDVASASGDSADVLADKAFWREYIKYVFAAGVTGPPGRDEKVAWPDGTSAGRRIVVEIPSSLAEIERAAIEATLEHVDGDKRRAATLLGVSLKTIYSRLREYAVRRTA